jgi:hypothetical protein
MPLVSVTTLVLGLAACSDDAPSRRTVDDLAPAASPRASFVLARVGEEIVVVTHDGATPTQLNEDPDSNEFLAAAVAVSDDTVAAFHDDGVVLVHADGSSDSAACDGCHGLAWSGSGLVTLRDDEIEGGVFDIVFLDDHLEERSSSTAQRITERSEDFTEPDEIGVELLAANEDTVWVAYPDRYGFGRGGSRAIAAYGRDGQLIGSTSVGGLLYDDALSPDGRYLAVADGGSGGACVTDASLDVVDLVRLRTLDTEPRIPVDAAYATDPDHLYALLFTGQELVWDGGDVLVGGYASVGNAPGDCDQSPMLFTRRFDPEAQLFEDEQAEGRIALPTGLGCDDLLVIGSQDFGAAQLHLSTGEVLGDEDDESLLYVPPHPEDC